MGRWDYFAFKGVQEFGCFLSSQKPGRCYSVSLSVEVPYWYRWDLLVFFLVLCHKEDEPRGKVWCLCCSLLQQLCECTSLQCVACVCCARLFSGSGGPKRVNTCPSVVFLSQR